VDLSQKKVAIVGFGRTGRSLLKFLKGRARRVMVSEADPSREDELRSLGVEYEIGNSPGFLARADLVLVSPGVPWKAAFLEEVRAKGVEVLGDVDFALKFMKARLVGITGSNGKSTTVALAAHILKKAGLKAEACGNIGAPLVEFAGRKYDYLVVELSSYQLEANSPRVLVSSILNCTPDHLSRHGSFEAYCSAKERVLLLQRHGFSVLNRGDPRAQIWERKVKVETKWFSSSGEADLEVREDGGWMGRKMVFEAAKMKLLGLHNMENAAAAFLIARGLGLSGDKIREGLYSFQPLEHRLEVFAEKEGKVFINDSKATNVDSVKRALQALKGRFVLIMGGRGKGETYRSLAPLVRAKVSLIVAIGEEAERIKEELGEEVPVLLAPSLSEAVEVSMGKLSEADGLLLSPACASFDMFSSFEERGRVFKEEVLRSLAHDG